MSVKMEIANEIRRQSNEYGKIMLANMKTDRGLAMLCHDICRHLNEVVIPLFKLNIKHFGGNNGK